MDYSKAHLKGIENNKIYALKVAGHLGFEGTMTEYGTDDLMCGYAI